MDYSEKVRVIYVGPSSITIPDGRWTKDSYNDWEGRKCLNTTGIFYGVLTKLLLF